MDDKYFKYPVTAERNHKQIRDKMSIENYAFQ